MKDNQISNKNYNKFLDNNLNKFCHIYNGTIVLSSTNIYKIFYFTNGNLFILALYIIKTI